MGRIGSAKNLIPARTACTGNALAAYQEINRTADVSAM